MNNSFVSWCMLLQFQKGAIMSAMNLAHWLTIPLQMVWKSYMEKKKKKKVLVHK